MNKENETCQSQLLVDTSAINTPELAELLEKYAFEALTNDFDQSKHDEARTELLQHIAAISAWNPTKEKLGDNDQFARLLHAVEAAVGMHSSASLSEARTALVTFLNSFAVLDRAEISKKCGICSGSMDVAGYPKSKDCGGDCLSCMAASGDPDCIRAAESVNTPTPGERETALEEAVKFMLSYENDDPATIEIIRSAFREQRNISDAQEFARTYCARKMRDALAVPASTASGSLPI